jgi:peptide/nickel transport system substrate-binding protein
MEQLFCDKYVTDPSIWNFPINFLPPDYADGYMLTGWEMTASNVMTCHLRTDIYWQNIAPANGRQFVASDVVFHYNRLTGLGNGFTKDPWIGTGWNSLQSITAPDKYTVVFTYVPGTSPLSIEIQLTTVGGGVNDFECPEAVAAYTTASSPAIIDWHKAVGTGAFILQDFVDASSVTFVKNPSYWGHDERWPQNQLPYLDKEKIIIVASTATAEAALRTGKIDGMGVSFADAALLKQTNPNIIQNVYAGGQEIGVDMRVDQAPFTDIRVRQAMQLAIDIPGIAATYYKGNATPWPSTLTQNQLGISGWGFPYPNWPADLQAEYAYNTTLAKQLLTQAGFPNGFTSTLLLQGSNAISNGDLYLVVQSYFAAVGINVTISSLDDAAWNSKCLGANRSYTGMCARALGCTGLTSDPFTELSKFTTGNMTDIPNVSDPKIDGWKAQALTSTTVDQVKQILHDENLYIAQQHFEISVADPSVFVMLQPWVKGVTGPSGAGWCWPGYNPNGNWIDHSGN